VPNIQLKGFEKVYIKAGETVDVEIPLDIKDLGLWNKSMVYVVEPGSFTVFAGASSGDLRVNATLTVV
jgi:beta-glucosidase